MRVKCIKDFYDLVRKTHVKVGDEFDADEKRGEELTSKNNKAGCVLCEPVTSTEKVSKAEPKSRKKKEA